MSKFKLLFSFLFLLFFTSVSMGLMHRCPTWRGCAVRQRNAADPTTIIFSSIPSGYHTRCMITTFPINFPVTYLGSTSGYMNVHTPKNLTGYPFGPIDIDVPENGGGSLEIRIHINVPYPKWHAAAIIACVKR